MKVWTHRKFREKRIPKMTKLVFFRCDCGDQCRFRNCDFFFTPIKNRFKCLKLPLIIYISSFFSLRSFRFSIRLDLFYSCAVSLVLNFLIFPIQIIGSIDSFFIWETQIYYINMFKLTKTTLCCVRRRIRNLLFDSTVLIMF